MPSQMETTFGSYATAPTQIVRAMATVSRFGSHSSFGSEEGNAQDRLTDELAQYVPGRRHDRARVGIPEQPLDVHVLRECAAAADAHRARGDVDRDVSRGRLALEHAQQRRVPRP